ncbi:MAG: patatin family protein [Alphaproteobacteria bacterium]|nr:patatin family protein [Alphaproteobacteria bacterium]
MQKTGLVLEGGAKRGIYTAGVLDVFMENNIRFDAVVGVSAGAIHGCSYVSKQRGRGIRYNLKYNNNYKFMSIRSWLLSGNIVDTQFAYHDLPERLDIYDNETFIKSDTQFYVTVSDVVSGNPEYILCKDMFADIDYLRASASMPFVSQIVEVNNKKYLDGGITDSIPLHACRKLGFTKNVVIATRPQGYRKKAFKHQWLAKLIYGKYPNFINAMINRHKMYNQEIEQMEKEAEAGNIVLIRPSRFINISKMETNPDIIQDMYNLGRQDALSILDRIKSFLSCNV